MKFKVSLHPKGKEFSVEASSEFEAANEAARVLVKADTSLVLKAWESDRFLIRVTPSKLSDEKIYAVSVMFHPSVVATRKKSGS